MDVLIVSEAELQIRTIDDWWRAHRSAAPALFTEELAAAIELIASAADRRPIGQARINWVAQYPAESDSISPLLRAVY